MNSKINRILILGNGASGKTHLSLQIKNGRNILHLDSIYWKNGSYNHNNRNHFHSEVDEVLNLDSWIIEGTPMPGFEKRADQADIIIFLDISIVVCLYRLLKRRIKGLFKRNPINQGCPAKLDIKTISWILKFNSNQKKVIIESLIGTKNISKLKIVKNKDDFNKLVYSLNVN